MADLPPSPEVPEDPQVYRPPVPAPDPPPVYPGAVVVPPAPPVAPEGEVTLIITAPYGCASFVAPGDGATPATTISNTGTVVPALEADALVALAASCGVTLERV